MTWIDGGITAPAGFTAAGVAAQIKPASTKLDCALLVSNVPASVAGTFTTNRFKAAPVLWCQALTARGTARAVFINSGNANACTGDPGFEDARTTASWIAEGIGASSEEVAVCSTGVIGVRLPMDRIQKGVEGCLAALSPTGSADASRAIMTTDTVPKEVALAITLPSGGEVRLGAIAKGAGMIAPNMATMISIVTTDAKISPATLADALRPAVQDSFNRICVDNDMSTNDTVLCFANGQSGTAALEPGSADYSAFCEGLATICREIAGRLVRDGEGATKFVEIRVSGAVTNSDALAVARAIAVSQLCKTAFFGQDPNWGRIACAAGYAGVAFDPDQFSLWLDDVQIMKDGRGADYQEADAAAVMQNRAFVIRVSLGDGPGSATFWTSDLSHDYVSINADYRS